MAEGNRVRVHETLLKHGIKRIVNRLDEDPTALRFPACPACNDAGFLLHSPTRETLRVRELRTQ
jgi:hypothetical protein